MTIMGLAFAGGVWMQAGSVPAAAQHVAAARQAAAPTCPGGPGADLPAPYTGWRAMQGVSAGTGIARSTTLAPGRSARATLAAATAVTFPVKTGRAAQPGTRAGLFAVDAAVAGVYRVALSAPVSVELVAGDAALASVAHGHGPDCSGIAKFVDYRLTPGRYLLQLSGATTPTVTVMVVRLS